METSEVKPAKKDWQQYRQKLPPLPPEVEAKRFAEMETAIRRDRREVILAECRQDGITMPADDIETALDNLAAWQDLLGEAGGRESLIDTVEEMLPPLPPRPKPAIRITPDLPRSPRKIARDAVLCSIVPPRQEPDVNPEVEEIQLTSLARIEKAMAQEQERVTELTNIDTDTTSGLRRYSNGSSLSIAGARREKARQDAIERLRLAW